jgi:hypothetical protein
MVFVAESFDLDLARKLTALVLDAQGTGPLKMAGIAQSAGSPGAPSLDTKIGEPLTAGLIRLFSSYGVMRAAVTAAMQAGR